MKTYIPSGEKPLSYEKSQMERHRLLLIPAQDDYNLYNMQASRVSEATTTLIMDYFQMRFSDHTLKIRDKRNLSFGCVGVGLPGVKVSVSENP